MCVVDMRARVCVRVYKQQFISMDLILLFIQCISLQQFIHLYVVWLLCADWCRLYTNNNLICVSFYRNSPEIPVFREREREKT